MHTEDRHREMVAALVKDGAVIKDELTPLQAHLWHMATGVAGEGGELLDAIKKFAVYQKPLDLDNVIEELGDIEFFLEAIRDALGIQREVTLAHNMEKLRKRYEAGKYSNEAAQTRADKIEYTDKIVVVYGPMASGKSRNAEAIAAHFRCKNIIDNFAGELAPYGGGGATTKGQPVLVGPGTLLLVTAPEVSAYWLRKIVVGANPDARDVYMQIVHIDEALEAIAPAS